MGRPPTPPSGSVILNGASNTDLVGASGGNGRGTDTLALIRSAAAADGPTATRYDKLTRHYRAAIALVSALLWITM
ncbi:MAG: hypothetical protein JWO67_6408 [Streptosporangiaceae bacterium]|nr:hypothetical protein [Streptosporangiaceae bacterium]